MPIKPSARHTVAFVGVGAALLLTPGCAQNNAPDSSNRGSNSHTSDTTVQDAFIVPQYFSGHCALQVGGNADLRFTATNNRTADTERLLAVSTDAARTVRITPEEGLTIEPGSSIAVGESTTRATGTAHPAATVTLDGVDRDARPGTSVDVTFSFQRTGDLTMRVPVEACPTEK